MTEEDGEVGLRRPACGRGIWEAVLSRSQLLRDRNRSREGRHVKIWERNGFKKTGQISKTLQWEVCFRNSKEARGAGAWEEV